MQRKPPKPKQRTMFLPPEIDQEYQQLFKAHEKTLKDMNITSHTLLIRWCMNLGKPIAEKFLKQIEEQTKKEKEN